MNDKCDYKNMQMCDRAREEGIVTFGRTIGGGSAATIVGSGKIDYCPYCGKSLKELEIVMKPIGNRWLHSPIVPIPSEDIEIRRWPFDWQGMAFSQCQDSQKFQEHIENLKKEKDKLPGYAQDSLDAVLNTTVFGCDFAAGPDVYAETMYGNQNGETKIINQYIKKVDKEAEPIENLKVLPFDETMDI